MNGGRGRFASSTSQATRPTLCASCSSWPATGTDPRDKRRRLCAPCERATRHQMSEDSK